MTIDRRRFFGLTAAGVVAGAFGGIPTVPASSRFKAVAFDGYAVFDPRPVLARAESLLPGRGAELVNSWRSRQFEYQWLRALAGRYADFMQTTEEALVFAAKQLRIDLTPEQREQLMQPYLGLTAWPDAAASLADLKRSGLRLAFLSNMTQEMLHAGIRVSHMEGVFDLVLSTDRIRAYKPDPRAYQIGVDALRLNREEILYVAFAGWDAAGARWFGYPTFWVDRLGLPPEELGVRPDATGKELSDVVRFTQAPA